MFIRSYHSQRSVKLRPRYLALTAKVVKVPSEICKYFAKPGICIGSTRLDHGIGDAQVKVVVVGGLFVVGEGVDASRHLGLVYCSQGHRRS